MLSLPILSHSLRPEDYAAGPIPTLSDYTDLWAAWDTVTQRMILREELLSQPIKLRNALVFYLGHIPTFLDIHLTRATNGTPTEPSYYPQIFERGIDPDVDNPEHCHAHSDIPDAWPPVEEILDFQSRVRNRVRVIYNANILERDRKLGRALWLAFESDKTIPPPGVRPDFEAMAQRARLESVPNQWITVPGRKLTLGMDDPDNDLGPDRYFGWDNERPSSTVDIPAFAAKARPITNEEYAFYLEQTHKTPIPASWSASSADNRTSEGRANTNGSHAYMNGDGPSLTDSYLKHKSVRTVYGLVPLEFALGWPVFASYDELAGCAQWMNGRIPSMEEVRSIYAYVDEMKTKEAEKVLGKTISAVNGSATWGSLWCNIMLKQPVISHKMVSKRPHHHTLSVRTPPAPCKVQTLASSSSTLRAAT
ncbi:MAG: hypothetical protein M1830_009744 [Pleopsidium flavum]|nr:MAG: hypothetical protein M1830_009744 [Pleopsidium flavum]